MRRHCETMVRHGWRVVQIGLAGAGELPVGRLNGVVLVRRRQARYRGGRLFRYAAAYLGFLVWARAVVRRIARRRRVRVVHVNNIPNFMVWAALPARSAGAGVILDLHDPVPELFLSKFGRVPLARTASWLLRLEERQAARRADIVLTVNERHRQVTVEHGVPAPRIRVIPNRADDNLFPQRPPRPSAPFVAYHGTVAPRMGLEVLVEAVALLRQRGLEIRGAIWGDGDAVAALQALRDQRDLGRAMEIPGRRFKLEEIRERLSEVGIGVVTLRRDVFTDLMLPTKLIEYVRLGIPAIVCRTPTVTGYFSDDAVWYLASLDPAQLADTISGVLKEPSLARERAARAQALPIARSWQDCESEFVHIVEEVSGVDVTLSRR